MKSNANLSEQDIVNISQKINNIPKDYFKKAPGS